MKTRALIAILAVSTSAFAADLFSELHWRAIGPIRGGRTRAAAGVPSQPNVFYIGAVNGGVFKTTDYGRTWNPIFDSQPTASIGAIAVAPSNPNIIYAGSGEGLQRPDLSTGDGIYKSTDAGKTWTHLGLRDGQQIPRIVVDPRNPDRLIVAVLGHPYGPNEERGIFRSVNGGQTFEKVLYKDENTGASDVEMDPSDAQTVYACLWESRQGPWENAAWHGTNGGIFKSTDGGTTWRPLTKGLPADGVVQAYLRVAPSNRNRLIASVGGEHSAGVYRSDDAGENWFQVTSDPRLTTRIEESLPAIDPKNADTVYIMTIVTWKSTDGGRTWNGFRGAPGGDDYQNMWINPLNPDIILLVSDQGAIVTVNAGATWSSWYNQPTAQMYHVSADNAFPYRLCGGQQESGSACVSSRGADGQITFREWHPVSAEEYAYVAADPLNPDMIYGAARAGVTVYDRRTGQVHNISPLPIHPADFRVLRTSPLMFSPVDPHLLYYAANTVWKTPDGGRTWNKISPDLTRKTWDQPASIGKYKDSPTAKPSQRGVIYTLGLSPLDVNRIWAGTDDGLIHLTTDGGLHWKDVTPPVLKPFQKVSIIDAGHFEAGTAYAAVNTLRLDDMNPHIYRTHDGGKTWTEIVNGIAAGAAADVVREDPKRKGLLYAGTEREVYVSFDDGDNWQSLRQNMPATSVRDLIVKDDDLAVATHGRGFWILDDITALRQLTPAVTNSPAFLFAPQTAIRIRWNMNEDTPLPPDEPAGANPPDGAVIDYYLGPQASGVAKIEILDSAGTKVREYSSDDQPDPADPQLAVPTYWVRPARTLANTPGLHRFLWDMHYTPLPRTGDELPISAIVHDTVFAPNSPWVMPGVYTVRLTVGGKSFTQQLNVKTDPRVHTSVVAQGVLSLAIYKDLQQASAALTQVRELRGRIARVSQPAALVAALGKKVQTLEGDAESRDTLKGVSTTLTALLQAIQYADVPPTAAQTAAVTARRAALAKVLQTWRTIQSVDLAALNPPLP